MQLLKIHKKQKVRKKVWEQNYNKELDQIYFSKLKEVLGEGVRIQPVPCVGRCQNAPVAVVGKNPLDHATKESVLNAVNKKDWKSEISYELSKLE